MSFYSNKDTAFGKIPHGWYNNNKFFNKRSKILTDADRNILTCLTVHIWRLKKPNADYPISKLLCNLYTNKGLLITMLDQRTIAEKTGYNRSTIIACIDKLEVYGAVVKLSGNNRKGKRLSNVYFMGLEAKDKDQGGKRKRVELLFSNSHLLKAGEKIPIEICDFIRENYNKDTRSFLLNPVPPFKESLPFLLFNKNSSLHTEEDSRIKMRRV